jgi:hypothetical protein
VLDSLAGGGAVDSGLYLGSDTLRFFKDNGSEESAGAVSCIRVYSGALTDAEVAAIGASQTCAPHASSAPHKKKCKKKKRKHRAAEAKKKCKKKRSARRRVAAAAGARAPGRPRS